ncbi:MAG TPA: hypothetical protein VFO16_17015 [Pseudonocardiaceae bacterium]|nr:hypothetical protein [Pseudonocardiaceae bacterium]
MVRQVYRELYSWHTERWDPWKDEPQSWSSQHEHVHRSDIRDKHIEHIEHIEAIGREDAGDEQFKVS